jgi:hypothetical protein
MQFYPFHHLVMRSTVKRPNRHDDFCFTSTGIRTKPCDVVKSMPLPFMDTPEWPAGNRTGHQPALVK